MAEVLTLEIKDLARRYGIEKLLFITLTFACPITDLREAQKRFHSLLTHVISQRYLKGVGCWERQRSGRIHFHLLVVGKEDYRSGVKFEELAKGEYRSAGPALRSEWAFWRTKRGLGTAAKYGFGRTEALPVKSTAEGVARYVGKYISKHVEQREESDKGARVVRFFGYGKGERRASSRFAFNTERAWVWRQKVAIWAARQGVETMAELSQVFGPRWAWFFHDEIMMVSDGLRYLTEETAREDQLCSQGIAHRVEHEELEGLVAFFARMQRLREDLTRRRIREVREVADEMCAPF